MLQLPHSAPEIIQMLKNADIHLVPAKAEKLWAAHGEKFVEAIAYVEQKAKEGKVANREGYFVKCLEEGWLVKKPEPEKRDPNTLTLEQQQWYDWACMTGICTNTPVKHLPTKMGDKCVLIPIKDRRPFDPPYDVVAIDVAFALSIQCKCNLKVHRTTVESDRNAVSCYGYYQSNFLRNMLSIFR